MPAAAGRFYPSDPAALAEALDACLARQPLEEAGPAVACLVPHAGYMFSGGVAGATYRKIAVQHRVVILGPNHFGRGTAPLAIVARGSWRTPLGDAAIDDELAGILRNHCPALADDSAAHEREHSIEAQIPFLQRSAQDFRFVPVAIGAAEYEALAALGRAMARAIEELPQPPLMIASSDMNHYESDAVTRIKDGKAIERIVALDPAGLYDVIRRDKITMCGYGPAIAVLSALKELGAVSADLVEYATSADAGGDPGAVVGYAGIIFRPVPVS